MSRGARFRFIIYLPWRKNSYVNPPENRRKKTRIFTNRIHCSGGKLRVLGRKWKGWDCFCHHERAMKLFEKNPGFHKITGQTVFAAPEMIESRQIHMEMCIKNHQKQTSMSEVIETFLGAYPLGHKRPNCISPDSLCIFSSIGTPKRDT